VREFIIFRGLAIRGKISKRRARETLESAELYKRGCMREFFSFCNVHIAREIIESFYNNVNPDMLNIKVTLSVFLINC